MFCLFFGFGLGSLPFRVVVPGHLNAALLTFAGGAGLAAVLGLGAFRARVAAA